MSKSEFRGDRARVKRKAVVEFMEKTMGNTRPCEECGATDWTEDTTRGEVVCNHCGLVTEQAMIDTGAEWTNHDSGEDRSRLGAAHDVQACRQGTLTPQLHLRI